MGVFGGVLVKKYYTQVQLHKRNLKSIVFHCNRLQQIEYEDHIIHTSTCTPAGTAIKIEWN